MDRLRKLIRPVSGWANTTWRKYRLLRWGTWVTVTLACLWVSLHVAVRAVPFNDSALRSLDTSAVITDRNGTFLRGYLSRDERWRLPVSLDDISPAVLEATIATEDKRFYQHSGIDWYAVGRAAIANLKAGRIVSGASTISMQVAGFAVVSRERTLRRKLKQAFLALQIDHHWTKQEILECYLTHASYGGNVCGVEAASRRYFNKTARQLSIGESALLAGLPQSPERLRPDRHMKRALQRRKHVLSRMQQAGKISSEDFDRINRLEIALNLSDVPVLAPHFCDHVRALYPGTPILQTTLDLKLQKQAERQLKAAVTRHSGGGVNNGAIVILDNQSCEVLALVGSADYANKFNDGQVNGAFGFRSPGSVLKPLFFAKALGEGMVTPDETLFDVPVSFAGYQPENYDRQFRGPVPALKALAWSLNIPAIEVLERIGVPEFRDMLAQMDVPLQVNKFGDPGLSLAIGTCSVRLIDMARAYASLATGGAISEATWLIDRAPRKRNNWITSEAAAAVLTALADETIRAPEELDPALTGLRGIAWKTGTSNGFRDAWTVAVTEKHTVGVWMGNMDGKPARALIGSKAAAPVALSLAAALQGKQSEDWPANSIQAEYKPACIMSGRSPGPHCPSITKSRFLRSADAKLCDMHQSVEVDSITRYCLCTRCSGGRTVERTTCLQVPHSAATWLRSNAHPWAEFLKTPHTPDCQVALQGEPPAIITPYSGSHIILLEELPAEQQKIALSATTADPSARLYWFLNESLVGGASASDGVRILPKPGYHKLVCMDEQGRSAESYFTIESSDQVVKAEQWSRSPNIEKFNRTMLSQHDLLNQKKKSPD